MLNTLATKLVEPVRWLVGAGIAYTLVTTTFFFVAGPQAQVTNANPTPPGTAPTSSSNTAVTTTSVNAILSRNLFGVAGNALGGSANLPEVATRLPLQLLGVFVSEHDNAGEDSAAIVSQKGKTGELYQIGDMLPGNAELIEVHPQYIVLRRAGARETLRFPAVDQAAAELATTANIANARSRRPPRNANTPISRVNNQLITEADRARSPREVLDTYRERIERDPESALRELGIAPVNAGSSEGYRLDNVARAPYLSQTGLQQGDVILSINGKAVGDIRQDQQEIDNILAQGSARLEIQRGTRRFFVTASLN